MPIERKTYETRSEKNIDFGIGFIGFFILNGLIIGFSWLLIIVFSDLNGAFNNPVVGLLANLLSFVPFLINLGVLILAGIFRPWIAIGVLIALAVIFVLGIIAALVLFIVCFQELGGL